MSNIGSITMQEWERAQIIGACARGEMKATVAAERLHITTRQVRRLEKRFAESGVGAMVSGRRGKPSNNQLAPGLAETALQLVRKDFAGFGPTLACEQLEERHGVTVSKETLRRLMTEAGLWTPKAVRRAALHQPRERRACFGELVQIDGSRHHWFGRRRAACTLLVYIDDATGRLLQLYFAGSESTASYFAATRRYVLQHGKPRAFYSDRAAVFRSPSATVTTCTQFQRALDELGIELICANSPQAKGRVERVNRVLQDRLAKQMQLEGIRDIDAANAWADEYVQRYNDRFGRTPRSKLDAHTPLHANDDLELILAARETRKLTAQLTLKHSNLLHRLDDTPDARGLIGQPIAIHTYADGRIELRGNRKVLQHTSLEIPKLANLTDVDSKTVHATLDKKRRNRLHRADPPAPIVAHGVQAAKKISAQKRI